MSYTMNAKLVQSPSKQEQNNMEQKKMEQKNMEQNNMEQKDTEQNNTEQKDTEQKDMEQKKTEQKNTEQNNTEQKKTVQKMIVAGYREFRDAVEAVDNTVQLNVYFTGTKDEFGVSWCPDCTTAEPLVNKALEAFAVKDSIFLVVYVGERTFWKDMQNPFRKDTDAPVSVIPTLIRWRSPARLDGNQCSKENLLQMFFTEDE